ncbi:MAG: hypothetical protein JNN24_04100 [Hyphomicrobium zavarzinii]|jgi:hypothetical protein|uniref:hypothetical protein n=1 Tax=Hyphomicrobium TaxID=81 RepID=UPI00037112EF|nr:MULTISPECIES: hypothetical protein [Hyphomicrobium]MBL8844933.1 hypothetical protein [Hyphomicrobium zavarzinii]WBT38564.1 hypothetical protein PE058_01440 [Hyphomicrobium sp. DMF-1]HML43650.1 hypothetical protein [Hyphomicrobium zavarzinii]
MEGTSFKSLVLGFIAGAIALVTVHELIGLWLYNSGYATRLPWSMEPSLMTGYPQIATDAVWGGVWGAVFALILGSVPRGSMTFRGALLGLIGPALVGTLVLIPLIRSEPPFLGNDINLIWPVLATGAGFGAATAWLYGFLTSGCRLP